MRIAMARQASRAAVAVTLIAGATGTLHSQGSEPSPARVRMIGSWAGTMIDEAGAGIPFGVRIRDSGQPLPLIALPAGAQSSIAGVKWVGDTLQWSEVSDISTVDYHLALGAAGDSLGGRYEVWFNGTFGSAGRIHVARVAEADSGTRPPAALEDGEALRLRRTPRPNN